MIGQTISHCRIIELSQFRRVVAAAFVVLLASSLSEAKQEVWVEVRSSNFIVVSNAGEKQARKAALQCEQIRAVFRQSLEVANNYPSPFVTVLAAKDEGTMRELLPEYWVKGHAHPAGLFASRLHQYYAAVELDSQGSNPYETFYHEYYHSITVPYFPDLPVWLSEGLAEFFGHTETEGKYVSMGRADDLQRELKDQPLIPLKVLFKVDQSSPYYNEANKTSIFYAESWALTHYLMIGDRQAHKALLAAYLDALSRGKSQDEAATAAFGDLSKLQTDLLVYIHQATFLYLKIPPAKIADEELKVRSLSEAEADAYRGGFSAVRGQTQEATATLREALRLDPNVALAHQYLGMVQFLEGQREKALESVSQAVALDPKNYFSHYLRAFLVTSGSGMMSGNTQVEEDLRQAIALSPEFSPPYALLAVYLAAPNRNLEEALALAQRAVSFEPGSSSYQLSLAQVLLRKNKFNEANLATARASAWARDPVERANAESFRSYMQQVRQFQSRTLTTGSGQLETSGEATAGIEASSAGQHLAPSNSGPTAMPATVLHLQTNIMVLGNASGVNLRSYLQEVIGSVRDKLLSPVARSSLSQPRTVLLEFAISKDGTVVNLKVASSSGDTTLDQSTRDVIAAASPLQALPRDFAGKSLQLRLKLSYSQESSVPQ
jgi:TonB family protein